MRRVHIGKQIGIHGLSQADGGRRLQLRRIQKRRGEQQNPFVSGGGQLVDALASQQIFTDGLRGFRAERVFAQHGSIHPFDDEIRIFALHPAAVHGQVVFRAFGGDVVSACRKNQRVFIRGLMDGDKRIRRFDIDVQLFAFKQRLNAALQQRVVIALGGFGDGRAFRHAETFGFFGGKRAGCGQRRIAAELHGAVFGAVLAVRQAAALAVPVDGTGLVIQQFGARGFVVFGAVGQRIIDGFAAGFADVLRLSVAGKNVVRRFGYGGFIRAARSESRSAPAAGQREQESGQNAEKEDFFHIFPVFGRTVLQQISISEFKLPKGALSIIEEEFGFVKEGFDAVPFGLRNRLAAVCGF